MHKYPLHQYLHKESKEYVFIHKQTLSVLSFAILSPSVMLISGGHSMIIRRISKGVKNQNWFVVYFIIGLKWKNDE
jgi:hypothetical protein